MAQDQSEAILSTEINENPAVPTEVRNGSEIPVFEKQPLNEEVTAGTLQGFELAEDPTGGVVKAESKQGESVEILNGEVGEESKGILGNAPVAEAPKSVIVRNFYLVRIPRPDLSGIITEIAAAETKLEEKRKKLHSISDAMKLKKSLRREADDSCKEHRTRANVLAGEVDNKYNEIKPMQDKVRVIRDAGSETRSASRGLPASSLEELQYRISEINYKMSHESMPLQEEKKLLRELQLLEKSRPSVEALEVHKTSVSDQEGQREGLQTQLKPLLAEVEALKQQRNAERMIAKTFKEESDEIEKEIAGLVKEHQLAYEAQEAAYQRLKSLRQESYNKEAEYRQFRRDVSQAFQLSKEKKVEELEKFCSEQMEKLHAKWRDPSFRSNYVAANERSTLRRFQTLDTRRLGLDETPAQPRLPEVEKPAPPVKQENGASKPEVAKEVKAAKVEEKKAAAVEKKVEGKEVKKHVEDPDDFVLVTEGSRRFAAEEETEDEVAVKERKKAESLQKAKEAEERKKRQSERNQARVAAKAAREAEDLAKKKEKERLKKERKKAAAAATASESEANVSASDNGPTETETETDFSASDGGVASQGEGLTSRQRKRVALRKRAGETPKEAVPERLAKKSGHNLLWVYLALILGVIAILVFAILALNSK